MEKSFCKVCPGESQPRCAIHMIANGILLDDIINDEKVEKTKYLVCHKNAIKIVDGRINIDNKCDECGLCRMVCKKSGERKFDYKLEKAIFQELGKLNIFLGAVFENATVATEVKTNGNFRQKRIDAIIKNGDKVIIIKVLSNLDKYNFYRRSYEEIVDNYKKSINESQIKVIFLIPLSKKEQAEKRGYETVTIDELHQIM